MAAKKHLLEVLSDRNRPASTPAPAAVPSRPRRDERRREKPSRSSPLLSISSNLGLVVLLGGVALVATTFGVGFMVGRAGGGEPGPGIATKAPNPLAEEDDEKNALAAASPAPSVAPRESAASGARVPKFGVHVVTYDPTPKNRDLAFETKKELELRGLSAVQVWEDSERRGKKFFITVGSFDRSDDPSLVSLLERVKGLSVGREKAPFAGALIREL